MRGLPLTIGIAGRKRSGKDTVAKIFVEMGYERRAFADPLKEMALAIDPIVHWQRQPDPGIMTFTLSEIIERYGWEVAKEEFPEVRRFLQRLGSEGVRGTFGPDAWVDLMFPIFRPTVITDVRFPSEVDAIRSRGRGVVIRVVRPGYDGDDHQSERALDDVDLPVVVNDSTIEELWRRAENAVQRETQAPRITIGCAICPSYTHASADHLADE